MNVGKYWTNAFGSESSHTVLESVFCAEHVSDLRFYGVVLQTYSNSVKNEASLFKRILSSFPFLAFAGLGSGKAVQKRVQQKKK